jgi:Putative amidoligase enzyme
MTLAIGNTYRRVPSHEVTLDRTGTFRKVHEFTLYVDVLVPENDPRQKGTLENVIDRVTFDLGSTFHGGPYICYSPIPVTNKTGKAAWRFQTRHTAYGSVTATIEVRGVAGKAEEFQHAICLNNQSAHSQQFYSFSEARRPRPLRPVPLPSNVKFGVELECTTSKTLRDIQAAMPVECQIIHVHSQGRQTTSTWKLVPDSSVSCNLNNPNCTTFELVSPVLVGGPGLADISKICDALKDQDTQLNKSAGFHVHINVEQYSFEQIVKICQQYIKYEGTQYSTASHR